ncbi:MAG: 4-diphosphocytidyl-2C-methyl-D-erythritol kinase [Firmicutes bacterium]|nr:4-diphosphocytidyl-2C-methyl-D-erythritol kinase [Bacillota bacterium]
MLLKAYAKINLSLDVVGKREDGYHLLRMIMQSIDLYDLINIDLAGSGIELSCDKEYVPNDSRNIAYKAAELFLKEYRIDSGVRIDIRKNIPVAAGLAGGSTDAAAVLKGLRDLLRPEITDEELMGLGVQIGADVPYCIAGGTALCEGIGEKITRLDPFRDKILILVKPPFGVSTKTVYQKLDIGKIRIHPPTNRLIKAISEQDLECVAKNMKNVLENVTLNRKHTLRLIKDELVGLGAIGAMMSGSGPSVFGFFEDMLQAQRCYDAMKLKYKETFITRTI